MRRRSLLKVAGASLTPLGITATNAVAKQKSNDFTEMYEQALHLRDEENWSTEQFRAHLQGHGMSFLYSDSSKAMPRYDGEQNDDSQASAQQLSKTLLDMSLTYTYAGAPTYDTYVDFGWDITVPRGVFVDGNLPPKDVVQIEWQANEADPNGNPYGSQYVVEHTGQPSSKTAGISMAYKDKAAYFNNPNGDDARYARSWSDYTGTKIYTRDGAPGSRDFYIRYYHIYSNTDYQISWTYGAPSISFYSNPKKWVADAMAYQDQMQNGKHWDCENDNC